MYDVAVIGAGPGGSTCANELAKQGFKVALIEKEFLAERCKACAGGIGAIIVENLEVPDSIIKRLVKNIKVFSPSAEVSIPLIRPNATVSRQEFDNFLAKRAVNNGAELFEKTQAIEFKNSFKTLITKNQDFDAKVFVCADGVNSIFRKYVKEPELRVTAMEYEIENVIEENYNIYYMNGLSPTGYGWVIPKKDTATLGVLGFPNQLGNKLKFYLDYLYEKHPHCSKIVGNKKIYKVKGWTIPYKANKRMVFKNILGVGDAVGLTSPLTGGGIHYASESGRIAAETIVEHLRNGKSLENYKKAWMKSWGKSIKYQHKMAVVLRKIWTDKGWDRCLEKISKDPIYAKNIGTSWNTYSFENKRTWAKMFSKIFKILIASKAKGEK